MYDYKSLRKIVRMLAVLFGVVIVLLVVTSLPLNKFAWLSVVLLVVVGVYFVTIPHKLIKELESMEQLVEKYKKSAKNSKD